MNHLDEAKLLSALLGVLKKESSKVRDGLLEELRTELQKDIEDQSGVKYLQLEEVDDLDKPIPIRVFRGDQGPRGITGAKGAKGDTGARGLRGTAGPLGAQGRVGPVGPTGPQGIRGQDGPTGPAGADGIDGATPDIKPVEDKLLKLLNDFKGSISAQVTRMAYAKGGSGSGSGEVRLLRLDDVDTTGLADGKFLRYNATSGKLEFVEGVGSVDLSSYDGHIIPGANNTYDLGSPQRQWRDLHLSGTSLFINGVPALQQDPETGNIVLPANTVIQSANGLSKSPVASQPNLDLYLEVANVSSIVTSEINNLVDGAPAALDTLNELAAAIGGDENFAVSIATNLSDKASNTYVNTQLSTKADTTTLSQYLQVANTFSESYNDLTNKPNLDIYAANSVVSLKANTSDLSQYLQVANVASVLDYSSLSNKPNLDVYAANSSVTSALSLKANITDLNQYLQVANTNNFSGVYSDLTSRPNLDVYASNTALALKANSADLSQYLQVANTFSESYNDLTDKPNLDVYAANSALALKADTADLSDYLQVANAAFISGDYNELSNKPNLDIYAANSALSLKANTSDLNQYVQVANVNSLIQASVDNLIDGAPGALDTLNELAGALGDDANFVTTITDSIDSKADTTLLSQYLQVANSTSFVTSNTLSTYLNVANTVGSGTSLVESKINNIVNLRSLRAGSNITLSENNGEILIAATGTLSVSDSMDFGFVDNDFGSITDDADTDPQFDFGTL